ncbi:MAG: hypothetical protein MJE77_46555 [Proteobacteria bacterium]|nr:hypothetical protein [Pseudomonadota bacterium]
MSRTEADIEALQRKLAKRGFMRDPRPISCAECGQRAVFVYTIKHTNIGGRSIEWCHHCHSERGWTRPGGDDRVEDAGFDLDQFLA